MDDGRKWFVAPVRFDQETLVGPVGPGHGTLTGVGSGTVTSTPDRRGGRGIGSGFFVFRVGPSRVTRDE